MNYMFLIVIMVVMFGMMFWQSKKAKQQQAERQDFRANLQPGTEVITIGGVIGKVVSVDTEYEEIVIDSEGSQIRFGFNAISREYVRPAYVHDDEVDENGNLLPTDSADEDQAAQKPIEGDVEVAQTETSPSIGSWAAADLHLQNRWEAGCRSSSTSSSCTYAGRTYSRLMALKPKRIWEPSESMTKISSYSVSTETTLPTTPPMVMTSVPRLKIGTKILALGLLLLSLLGLPEHHAKHDDHDDDEKHVIQSTTP